MPLQTDAGRSGDGVIIHLIVRKLLPMSGAAGAAIVAATMLTGATAAAHKDPGGDVYPFVIVEKGRFAIYFKNNLKGRHYRTVVDTAGKLVVERQEVSDVEFADYGIRYKRRELGDRRFVFPRGPHDHGGKPFYDVIERGREQVQPQRVRLPWGRRNVDLVHDAVVTERDVVLLTTRELWFHRFQVAGGSAGMVALRVGDPFAILGALPVASNIAQFKDEYIVCWIDKSNRMLLTAWSPHTGRSRTTTVLPKTDWNTSISIAVVGNTLLIAHHGAVGGPGASQIKTILKKLPL